MKILSVLFITALFMSSAYGHTLIVTKELAEQNKEIIEGYKGYVIELLKTSVDDYISTLPDDEPDIPDPDPDPDPPHNDDIRKQEEHNALLALVPDSAIKATTAQGINENSVVIIEEGVEVIVGTNINTEMIRVDGTLTIDPSQNIDIICDTIIVTPTGTLNILSDNDVNITFRRLSEIDDPHQLSLGLISHGDVNIAGVEKSEFLGVKRVDANLEARLIELDTDPAGWSIDDHIMVTRESPIYPIKSVGKITHIDGPMVEYISGHDLSDVTISDDWPLYAINMSRNIKMLAQDPAHIMFMHGGEVTFMNVEVVGMGRTDKRKIVTDHIGGDNQRGRYAIHVHKHGADFNSSPALISGCVVDGSTGWGIVNHNSYALIEDNVAYNCIGAGFVAEDGSEIGSFMRNLSVLNTGSNTHDALDLTRIKAQDFGHGGWGYWFQGAGGIIVEDNIAIGAKEAGFCIFGAKGRKLDTPLDSKFRKENYIGDIKIFEGKDWMDTKNVPYRRFINNTSILCQVGFEAWFHNSDETYHDVLSVVENFKAKGVRWLFKTPYLRNIHFKNIEGWGYRGYGNLWKSSVANDVNSNMLYENIDMRGFFGGLEFIIANDVVEGPPDPDGGPYRRIDIKNVTLDGSTEEAYNFQSRRRTSTSYIDGDILWLR